MTRNTYRPVWFGPVAAFFLGVLTAFGLAPYFLWPLSLLGLAGVGRLYLVSGTVRRAALIGWGFATGYFGHGLVWIIEPFLVDAARYGWMAPFALVLLAGGLALFWAAAFALAWRVGLGPRLRIVALIGTFALAEFGRAYLLTGFPWAGLAQIWVDNPLSQTLTWIGPHGLALATLGLGFGGGYVLSQRFHVGSALGLAATTIGFATLSTGVALPDSPPGSGHVVRLIQPNAPQHQKWDPAYAPVFFNRQVDFTAAGDRPDLIIWPETSVPVWLENAAPTLEHIAAAAGGVPVVLGIQRSEGRRIFNSLAQLDSMGRPASVYDKHHLVPFGEYVPFGDLLARIGIHGFATTRGQGFSAGLGAQLLDLGPLGRALPLICYEAVFPQGMRTGAGRADFLLQITNDAWFGARSGPYQHLAQARMRAIEQGVPMVRVANTGISAMIDPYGRVMASLALGEAGFVDAELPSPIAPTLYSRTGDGPVFLLVLTLLAGVILLQRFLRPAICD